MNVASTELTDLCKKVFEGMGFPLGDYEDCAQAITWLEMHGLPVLGDIQQSTPNWALPKSQAATILFEDDSVAVIDAKENGGLIYGSLALDLAYLKALQSGFAWVKLQQAHHCQLILPSLVQCTHRGMNVAVFWHDKQQAHVATIQAAWQYPHYAIYPSALPDSQQNPPTLSILCTTNFALTPQIPASSPAQSPLFCMTPADFAAHYQQHNEAGLDIDEAIWTQLVALSKNVLVASTKLSRLQGAG